MTRMLIGLPARSMTYLKPARAIWLRTWCRGRSQCYPNCRSRQTASSTARASLHSILRAARSSGGRPSLRTGPPSRPVLNQRMPSRRACVTSFCASSNGQTMPCHSTRASLTWAGIRCAPYASCSPFSPRMEPPPPYLSSSRPLRLAASPHICARRRAGWTSGTSSSLLRCATAPSRMARRRSSSCTPRARHPCVSSTLTSSTRGTRPRGGRHKPRPRHRIDFRFGRCRRSGGRRTHSAAASDVTGRRAPPCVVGGWSFGGTVAVSLASRLQQGGVHVAALVLSTLSCSLRRSPSPCESRATQPT